MEGGRAGPSAGQAKAAGASGFCMGAAWRDLEGARHGRGRRDGLRVKAIGLETCMTLGMLEHDAAGG